MASIKLSSATRKSFALGPSVRILLSQYKLDPDKISSSGPHQTLLKGDVLAYIKHGNPTPATTTVFTPKLDISGYQPKTGPEGFSKIAKKLLET